MKKLKKKSKQKNVANASRIASIHRYTLRAYTTFYEQSAALFPRKLFVPQTHLAPFREILLE